MSAPAPGRFCPADYRTAPADLNRAPDLEAEAAYVIGGLYGNAFALDAIEALAGAEARPPMLLFNGDAHWFDADAALFSALDARLARYPAIRGNVEAELTREGDTGAGCGCAYPPDTDDGLVERSNAILARLRAVAGPLPAVKARLTALPSTLTLSVGGLRAGIVHGDAESLAGWGFAADRLDDPAALAWLDGVRRASQIDLFASTHTCGAAMRRFSLPSGELLVANNGAAGMSNFAGDRRGLITRISTHASPHPALYGETFNGVHVDALPVAFDDEAFLAAFDALWPAGSPAALSYRARILGLSGDSLARAMPASAKTVPRR